MGILRCKLCSSVRQFGNTTNQQYQNASSNPLSISIIKTVPSTTGWTEISSSTSHEHTDTSIIKTLPPTTAEPPTSKSHEHTETSIIKTLPSTTFSTHTHSSTSIKPPPPPLKGIRQGSTLTYGTDTSTSVLYTISTDSSSMPSVTDTSIPDTTPGFSLTFTKRDVKATGK
ncbi:hypothetical protein BDZ45DRAFT_414866 [Acephala macrosclerotiorum]|nr:hypothetical protein BDZ45DRAFT_414866 [Acephala macrosclerotiorum]